MENPEKQFNQLEVEPGQEALIAELKEKLNNAYNTDAIDAHEKVFEYTDEIKKKYPDYSKYRLWHLVIFSTIGKSMEITHFDFPGDDSVERFIKSL